MNNSTDVRTVLRETFQVHSAPHMWLPALFVLVAAGAFVVLLGQILYVGSGPDLVPGAFRLHVAIWAIVCWLVTTFSAYLGGFVMGWLSGPRI